MLILIALLGAGPAAAKDKVERVTGNVVVLGADAPLGLERPKQQEEGSEPIPPKSSTKESQKEYDAEVDTYQDLRDDFAALDAELAELGPAIAACAGTAGAQPGAKSTLHVTVSNRGIISRATPEKSGDEALSGCAHDELFKRQTAVVLHGHDRSVAYTFTFQAAPAAVPTPIDATLGIAGIAFGASSEALPNRVNSASSGNTTHYYRTNDADVAYLGIAVGVAFSFDADQGLYAARIRGTGDVATFTLREKTTERLGNPKWDAKLKTWYWRGDRVLYVFEGDASGETGQLTIMDIERAKAANLVAVLPGDAAPGELAPGQKLPKVLQQPKTESATP